MTDNLAEINSYKQDCSPARALQALLKAEFQKS